MGTSWVRFHFGEKVFFVVIVCWIVGYVHFWFFKNGFVFVVLHMV